MRSLLLGGFAVAVLSGMAGGARADADSLDDLVGPREIALGEALRGGATGAAAAYLNPSGASLSRELVFEGGYGYRGTDSASLIGVSACDSTNAVPGCFFYEYAGSNPELDGMSLHRTTHVGGVALSRVLVPRILIGGTAKYYRFHTDMAGQDGERDASGTTFDLGATVRLSEMINVGASAQNLWATEKSPQFPRAFGGGVYLRPSPMVSFSFDTRWRLDGDEGARYGGGAELFLRGAGGQAGFPIRAGALHDNSLGTTYLSAGLGYASPTWGIDIAGRSAVKGGGGDDTLIIASMRIFGPRMATPAID